MDGPGAGLLSCPRVIAQIRRNRVSIDQPERCATRTATPLQTQASASCKCSRAAVAELRKTVRACSGFSPHRLLLVKAAREPAAACLQKAGSREPGTAQKRRFWLGTRATHPRELLALKRIQVIFSGGGENPHTDHRGRSVLLKNIISRLCLQRACQRGICLLTTDNKAPQAPTHTTAERVCEIRCCLWRDGGRADRKGRAAVRNVPKPESLSGASCSVG